MISDPGENTELPCMLGHNLVVIYKYVYNYSDDVIRWCTACGSIVIDEDYDGRTKPGSIRKMRGPTLLGFKG